MDDEHTLYICKDNRTRVYDKSTHKVTSYPRYLMSQYLGRSLDSSEEVHHIDGNPLNNDLSNLKVIDGREHRIIHARKYYDTTAICCYCGKEFLWTAISQSRHYSNKRRRNSMTGPYCSKRCAALGSMST